jgi:thymidylate kinase
MLLTFSGLDGSGKTTLIAGLRGVLERSGRPVRVLTMYDHVGVYAWLRGVRDAIGVAAAGGEANRPGHRGAAAGEPSIFLKVLRSRSIKRVVYEVDLAMFHLYRLYQERLRGRILILDRYFYDSIVDLAEGVPDVELRSLSRWVPTPDVAIYVEATPEVAFARKGEYTVDRLRQRARIYQQVFADVRSALVVRNQGAPASALEIIRARVFAGLSA